MFHNLRVVAIAVLIASLFNLVACLPASDFQASEASIDGDGSVADVKISPPTSVTASIYQTYSVSVSWIAANAEQTSVSSYLVYRNDVQIASVSSNTLNYVDSSVSVGESYSYHVIAKSIENSLSGKSETVSISLPVVKTFVSSAAQFNTAIAQAQPGHRIVIRNGTYTDWASTVGPSVLGTAQNPIVIEPESIDGVTFTHSTLNPALPVFFLNGKYVTFQNFKFSLCGTNSVEINGSFNRFLNNSFTTCGDTTNQYGRVVAINAHPSAGTAAKGNLIQGNRFSDSKVMSLSLVVSGTASVFPTDNIFRSNTFSDIGHNVPNAANSNGDNGREALQIGQSGTASVSLNTLIEKNVFIRVNGDNELISLKTSGNTVQDNFCYESRGMISLRFSNRSTIQRNTLIRCGGISVAGSDHRVINNLVYQPLIAGISLEPEVNHRGRDTAPPGSNPTTAITCTNAAGTASYFWPSTIGPCDYGDKQVESSSDAPICIVKVAGSARGAIDSTYSVAPLAAVCSTTAGDWVSAGNYQLPARRNFIAYNTVIAGGTCPITTDIAKADCWAVNSQPATTSTILNSVLAFSMSEETPMSFARENMIANNIFVSAISGQSGITFTSPTSSLVGSGTTAPYISKVAIGHWTVQGQAANQTFARNLFFNTASSSSLGTIPTGALATGASTLTSNPGINLSGSGYAFTPWTGAPSEAQLLAADAWTMSLSINGPAAGSGFSAFSSILPTGFTVSTDVTTDLKQVVRNSPADLGALNIP